MKYPINYIIKVLIIIAFFCVLTVSLFASAPSSIVPTNAKAKPTKYGINLDKPIVVDDNQWTVTIRLPANATTGYQWYLKSYNNTLIRPKSYRYVLNNAKDTKRVGQGGSAEFKLTVSKRFKTVPQITQLTFIYARAWDLSDQSTTEVITLLSK
ncbi:protease inhibitor I42 family protein [Thiotrichales bacterium 19S3-7]|nr:protease inhibitor I42 family protein [Thiotrichales bacterium 19S3-7]MCF6802479.1 protease inhibitor I42 family protein [Thiotrichales bacterium 19S3-11]